MKQKIQLWIISILIIYSIFSFFYIQNLSNRIRSIDKIAENIRIVSQNSINEIKSNIKSANDNIENEFKNNLNNQSEIITEKYLTSFENQLKILKKNIEKEQKRLNQLQEKKQRIYNNLPDQVTLDELNDYYANKWKSTTSSYGTFESFQTKLGQLSFYKGDFSFSYIPSSRKVAWIKIGKEQSTTNSELIKAWLNESASAKVRLGYHLIYNRTRPSDYGEYTEKLYRKGDLYFKTYYQYERVQGTYGRHSLQYTFYIEVGSELRKKQYKLEQYNNKLGS